MKRKILFLVFVIMFCTGCHVEYNLDLDDYTNIKENVLLHSDSVLDNEKFSNYNYYLPIDYIADDASVYEKKHESVEYYEKEKGDDLLKFTYNKFNIESLDNSMFANSCYEYVNITKHLQCNMEDCKDLLLLSSSSKFLCFDKYDSLTHVDVVIKSKYDLVNTNADKVDNNKYIWKINRENMSDKHLYLVLDISDKKNDYSAVAKKEKFYIIVVFITVVLILGGVYLLFKKKGNRKNKI